jgi:hypothetical protein
MGHMNVSVAGITLNTALQPAGGCEALGGLELSAAITDEAYRGILKVKDRGGI